MLANLHFLTKINFENMLGKLLYSKIQLPNYKVIRFEIAEEIEHK